MQADLADVPERPGVYLFKGAGDKVLYVGKARNLRNRLRSYFQERAGLDARKAAMVKSVKDFSWVVTDNELEALILEANFIKQFKPRYNIILRDDKQYPYIRITAAEEWPRIEVVRRVSRDGNLYFGPYVPAQAMWEAVAFIRRNFSIRTCGYLLDRPRRPCIQHQMRKCPAPCAGKISRDDYLKVVEEARLFLLGEKQELIGSLEERMQRLAEETRFEEAAVIRDRIAKLRQAFESQKVVAPELGDTDIFGFSGPSGPERGPAAVHLQFLRNGALIGVKNFFIDRPVAAEEPELMRSVMGLFYSKEVLPPETVLTNIMPEDAETLRALLMNKRGSGVSIETPSEGKKLDLLRMANENARLSLLAKQKPRGDELEESVRDKLGLDIIPLAIGAFDISTIQGSESAGSFVWWSGGGFLKERYRHLRVRSVQGVDDYAMMREIVARIAAGLEGELPDLILVDGGKGQLDAASQVLREAGVRARVAGIAKKPDRVFLPSGGVIDLEDRSAASLLLKRIRDEAHRFAVTFHRKLRDKRLMESSLEEIPGIGRKRRLELLRHFGSLEAIRGASEEDLLKVKGLNRRLAGAVSVWSAQQKGGQEHAREATAEAG